VKYLPAKVGRLIEPFAGSAAVSIAVACDRKAERFMINDVNEPLIALWDQIINRPEKIATAYENYGKTNREKSVSSMIGYDMTSITLAARVLFIPARAMCEGRDPI